MLWARAKDPSSSCDFTCFRRRTYISFDFAAVLTGTISKGGWLLGSGSILQGLFCFTLRGSCLFLNSR